jgi:hypothetical protein
MPTGLFIVSSGFGLRHYHSDGINAAAFQVTTMISEERSLKQRILEVAVHDRFVTATRWCATTVAVPQLLLATLPLWVFIDVHNSGTAFTPLAFLFATTFFGVQVTVLFFAWTLRQKAPFSLWFLAGVYSTGLAILGLCDRANIDVNDLKPLILQPGAVLPPNEIFGRDFPLGIAIGSFTSAQLLGILPLVLVVLVLVGRSQRWHLDEIKVR